MGGEDARGSTADQPPSGGPDEILVEHGGSWRRTTWTDAELYRLLLVLSARTKPPMDALAACYPFGRPGWRDCVTQR